MQLIESWQGIVPLLMVGAAVMGGVVTAFVRLTERNTPVDTGLLHGRMGVMAVILMLVLTAMGEPVSASLTPAIGLLVLTVILGVALYFIIRRKGILPWPVIFIHAAFAVAGLLVLVFGLPL